MAFKGFLISWAIPEASLPREMRRSLSSICRSISLSFPAAFCSSRNMIYMPAAPPTSNIKRRAIKLSVVLLSVSRTTLLDILISSDVVRDTLRRTTLSFIALLYMLLVGGAAGIYIIFRLEQKAAGKLKEMERQMELKERLISLGKLASGMAHEIRNPLNAMSMSIQRLKREFVPAAEKKDEYYKFIDIVRAELTRVNQLVEEFLLSTKSHAPMEDEKLRTIVEEVAIILGERANAKGIRIINQVDGALVVRCQKERLKQAFHNLVLNSIEAIGKDGAVTVSSQLDGLSAHVIIKDTGPGIKKEALSKVFEYHYTTKDKGMGLGLPISFTIIKDHGGDLHVTSDEGKGATFIITLPMKR